MGDHDLVAYDVHVPVTVSSKEFALIVASTYGSSARVEFIGQSSQGLKRRAEVLTLLGALLTWCERKGIDVRKELGFKS